uniref:Uncharacterized protein n=1 Tax=Picea glauca TaxID=3330 RepID=A0A101LZH8_PICGL|nr:hypothetical protein ABT39_MTgene5236 [Picea glauca]
MAENILKNNLLLITIRNNLCTFTATRVRNITTLHPRGVCFSSFRAGCRRNLLKKRFHDCSA